ncbi:glycoside hydrolase family 3 N-terminal domain-containing protein [Aestuariimicrobium sp. Y1814]|uniref:glycoside hydrolase family 3 protein n=1 Tax=Aestuariimicrobium sp. Y1814 TaxID=3418742 RepID=UPI003DA79B95
MTPLDSSLSRRAVLATGAGVAGAIACAGQASADPVNSKGKGWIRSTLARMTKDQKIGQLFIAELYGATADTPDNRNVTQFGHATPAEVVRKLHLGGVIYFAWTNSFQNPRQVAALSNGLQRAALTAGQKVSVPLQIATDQEMGVVTRLGSPATQFPGSMALGAGRSTDDAREAADITGKELRAVGINVNFAPTSDVNVNPLNPVIGVRAFSSDPTLTADMVRAQVSGYQDRGNVSSSTKHFPGHGDTAVDSHYGLPIIDHTREEWETIDAPPFRAAIAAGVDMVMTAHLLMPAFDDSGDPATLSKPIMTGLLRQQLGYDGVVVTDSLAMQGVRDKYGDAEVAVRALEAGVDQLLMAPKPLEAIAAIKAALASGRLTWKDIDAKVERILTLKFRRGYVAEPYVDVNKVDAYLGNTAHMQAADAISDRTVTLVTNDGILPLSTGKKVLVTGWGVSTTATVGNLLTAAGHPSTVVETATNPNATRIAAAVAAAAGVDVVVVLTNNARTSANVGQRNLIAALRATGKPVVVVAVRDPYDLTWVEGAAKIATYSYSPVTPGSLVRVLTGQVNPGGLLPVDLVSPTDVNTVIHPFGHGLSY